MEQLVLKVLKFDLGCITIHNFMDRFLKAADADANTKIMSNVGSIESLSTSPMASSSHSTTSTTTSTLPS